MPRAKFIQMMVLDVLAVCVASAVALLMMYSCVKAREHSESSAAAADGSTAYNSSAAAVSGVWLFFEIYLVHTFRAKFQQFQFPVIIYSIVANVAFVYASRLGTMAAAIALVKKLLEACLTGLGVATGVSLFILPKSTRGIVFKQMAGYIGGLRAALNAHTVYFETLEKDDMFGRAETYDSTVEKVTDKGKVYSPEAQAIRTACQKVTDLHAKIHGDLTFAKREVAIGKLGPDDLQAIFRHLRQTMIPVVGLSFVVDIFQRLSDYNKWNQPIDATGAEIPDQVRQRVRLEWNEIMRAVHDPFSSMIHTIDEGLHHVSLQLELTKPPKPSKAGKEPEDVEATASPKPGEKGFGEYYEKKLRNFKYAKRVALRTWSEEKGIILPPDFFEHPSSVHLDVDDIPDDKFGVGRDRSRRQLYLILYVSLLSHLMSTDADYITGGAAARIHWPRCP